MTDKARDDARLPEAAEALLESWPAPERGALDWEQSADLTMARVKMAPKGSTDDALLVAPLAREADEPEELVTEEALAEEWEELLSTRGAQIEAAGQSARSAATANETGDTPPAEEDIPPAEEPVVEAASHMPPAEEPNLAAIARSVLTDRDRDREHADIAREALSVVTRARTSSPPRAPEKQARAASPTPQQPRPRATPAPQRAEAPPSPPPAGRRGTVIAGIVGAATALAAAAAVALVVSHQKGDFSAIPEGTTTPAAAVQHEKRSEETSKPEKPAAEEPAVVALDQLKTEAEAQEQSKAKGAQAPAALAAPKESAPTAKRARTAAAPPPAPAASVALAEEAEPSAPAAEESAPGDSQMQPAELRPALPEQPSAGAVSAAVASVMNQARLCVAGQTEGSKAALTFGSDGRVAGVSVTGPAAGTPAEACIRAALSKARVAPFAKPSFAASITVRPP